MQEENITDQGIADVSQLNTPAPAAAVGSEPKAITLEEINQRLGKQFPDIGTALKSVEDTFSYVGKKKEDIQKEVLSTVQADNGKIETLAKSVEQLTKEMFFKDNPQYAEPSIRKFIEATGGNPSEVVNRPEFQEIFQKVSGFEESQKLRTVLESNPRLASSQDSLAKAREVLSTSGKSEEVDSLATKAVKDAYGL